MGTIEGMEEIGLVLAEVFAAKMGEIHRQAETLAALDYEAAKAWAKSVMAHIAATPAPPSLPQEGQTDQPNEPPKGGGSVAP